MYKVKEYVNIFGLAKWGKTGNEIMNKNNAIKPSNLF
jgi:hypothetical protein